MSIDIRNRSCQRVGVAFPGGYRGIGDYAAGGVKDPALD